LVHNSRSVFVGVLSLGGYNDTYAFGILGGLFRLSVGAGRGGDRSVFAGIERELTNRFNAGRAFWNSPLTTLTSALQSRFPFELLCIEVHHQSTVTTIKTLMKEE